MVWMFSHRTLFTKQGAQGADPQILVWGFLGYGEAQNWETAYSRDQQWIGTADAQRTEREAGSHEYRELKNKAAEGRREESGYKD